MNCSFCLILSKEKKEFEISGFAAFSNSPIFIGGNFIV